MIDFDRIDEDIEKMRQERIENGLPPEPPEPFLPVAHSVLLCERVAPVRAVIVKYAQLTYQTNKLIPFDVSKFDKYRKDLELLIVSQSLTCSMWGVFLLRSVKSIEAVNRVIEAGTTELSPVDVAKDLYLNLELLGLGPPGVHSAFSFDGWNEERRQREEDTKREIERLMTDEAAPLTVEVNEYYCRFISIQHLL
jgi:hypothetical protein